MGQGRAAVRLGLNSHRSRFSDFEVRPCASVVTIRTRRPITPGSLRGDDADAERRLGLAVLDQVHAPCACGSTRTGRPAAPLMRWFRWSLSGRLRWPPPELPHLPGTLRLMIPFCDRITPKLLLVARARRRVPSPVIAALHPKRLVAREQDGGDFAIALCPAALELAHRRTFQAQPRRREHRVAAADPVIAKIASQAVTQRRREGW